jgi:ATP-dependent Zn protease
MVIVSADRFLDILNSNRDIKEVYIKDNYIHLFDEKEGQIYKTILSGIDLSKLSKEYPITTYTKSSKYLNYIAIALLFSILITVVFILRVDRKNRRDEAVGVIKSEPDGGGEIEPIYTTGIGFKDVVGIEDAKEDLEEIVEFLREPFKFKQLDLKMPKGVLLVGPPGVGKTLLAKAIASEADVPFFYHSGANFVQIYVGMGAKRVKELFKKAKEMAPSIIFIDEIDAIGKSRDKLNNEEREATLNQLLVEMDGFEENLGVVVIGATNRVDILDNALLRAGRFDRRVFIELPNIREREQIIRYYLRNKRFDFDIKEVAKSTAGFSPATLEVLINEAALDAYKERSSIIKIKHIYNVMDKVMYGKKRVKIYSKKEKEILALSQSAKGVMASLFGFDFEKLSLLSPFRVSTELLSKRVEENRVKVFLSGIIFLEMEYNDFFKISIEDKREIEKSLYRLKEYSYNSEIDRDILFSYKEEVKRMLEFRTDIIREIAKELIERENLSQTDIAKRLNEVF